MKIPYALCAEFEDPSTLVAATSALSALGYVDFDAFTPFPLEALDEALPKKKNPMPSIALVGGMLGASGGYFMQWYANVIDYPIRIAGRPDHSWPAFIPITFELGVLGAAVFSVIGMLVLNGLPRIHHPIFDAPEFDRASVDRFFIAVLCRDPIFSSERSRLELLSLGAKQVSEIFDAEGDA